MLEPADSQASKETIRDWTFMVYMAAGDSHKLDTVAVRDLEEMEVGTTGNQNVGVVVQINRHWPKSAQRYEVTDGQTTLLKQLAGRTDMGDGQTLSAFLTKVVATPRLQAKNYCLVLWGHAFGVGFGRDGGDALLLPELKSALDEFRKARMGKPLELLGGNACSLSYLEAAFELKDVASLMVASQITVPFAGWPYGAILSRIGHDTGPIALAKLIVDTYVTQFDDLPGGERLAMTMLNLAHAGVCGQELRTLASSIHDQISGGFDTTTMAALRDTFMGAAAGDVRPLIDLTTLCRILRGDGPDEMADPVVAAAKALLEALQPADPPFGSVDLAPVVNTHTLVAYHRAHADLIDLKGIGIYAPFITDQGILDRLELAAPSPGGKGSLESGKAKYEALELIKPTKGAPGNWARLVYDDLQRTIPAELMISIDGIGELQTGDRADVAQIIMSMEAVLNGLDRAIARARRDIINAIVSGPTLSEAEVAQLARQGGDTLAPAKPKSAFGPPWLRLIPSLTLKEWKDIAEMKGEQAKVGTNWYFAAGPSSQRLDVVDIAVERLALIELAISVTERVVRRGLTNARFGLGPFSPNKLTGDIKPGLGNGDGKAGSGPGDGKAGSGNGDGKAGSGDEGGLLRPVASSADLRVDLALGRVAELFTRVGESLVALEAAAADVEVAARSTLLLWPLSTPDPRDGQRATVQELDQKLGVLADASAETRRTLRSVLAHPVYGLGPGEEPLSTDTREALAQRGGLSRRFLKLL